MKQELIDTLAAYEEAVREVMTLEHHSAIQEYLFIKGMETGLCFYVAEKYSIEKWQELSFLLDKYGLLNETYLYVCRTPRYHGFEKEQTIEVLNKRIEVLKELISKI